MIGIGKLMVRAEAMLQKKPMKKPLLAVGKTSPYPMVVSVTTAHHNPVN